MTVITLGHAPVFNAQRRGDDAVALIHAGDAVTWRQLEERSSRRARALRSLGVGAHDVVSIALPNSNALYEFAFALWKLGATPNVLSWRLPEAELEDLLALARPKVLISGSPLRRQLCPVVGADFGADFPESTPLAEAVSQPWKAMASGGSTGRPKIIVAPGPGRFETDDPYLRLPRDGVVLNPGPLYHNAPFSLTVRALLRGNAIVGMAKFDPEQALKLIEQYGVQWVNFVPTMMGRIWQLPETIRTRYDVSTLETVWHMAAVMPPHLKEAWIGWLGAEKIWEFYGSTEAVGATIISGEEWLQHKGSVGKPFGCKVRVLDQALKDAACGEIGEIYFMPNSGAASTYTYIGAEPRRSPDGYETVGDFGWLDSDGYLYIADRRTDLIISGGANIYPAEVESALAAHPGVETAVVIGLPHPDLGAAVHAIVKPTPGWEGRLGAEQLMPFLRQRLAPPKLPRSYEFTTVELRDEAGKVRRAQLREERAAGLEAESKC